MTRIDTKSLITFILAFFALFSAGQNPQSSLDPGFEEAVANGKLVNEGFNRCISYVNSWMNYADPSSGLIPRNIRESKDIWNAWDAAADNYPFIVLTSSILMPEFFQEEALNMLKAERTLTSRIGKLPDTWSFSKKGFQNESIDTSQVIFGSAEYMKDGLIPLTEWLGQSPWSDRMLEILDDLPQIARRIEKVKGDWLGNSAEVEVNGDLLQVLSRMHWFTGKPEYLDWAVEIADYYLNDERLPTIGLDHLRIRDHGCEIISGLCEVYFAASYARPEKRTQWRKYIHLMLDRILEIGRNEDGLFYDEVNPKTGEVLSKRPADNFGYTLNAYYFISQIDSTPAYRDAVIKALSSLNENYRNFDWENGSADGYADAIEGTLNLYNREQIPSVKEWLDSEIKVLWSKQKPDGMIEGWHGDGNFARTTVMYCLWKTQGITASPWDENLKIGAVSRESKKKIAISCTNAWKGKIKFDSPRYSEKMHFPADYPRINQFQSWFSVKLDKKYQLTNFSRNNTKTVTGKMLSEGIEMDLKPGETIYLIVKE